MTLKRHHKILIGSFGTIVILFMITTSIFLYLLFVNQNLNYQILNKKIGTLETETNSKINELAKNVLETKDIVGSELGSLNKEINLLKASAGEDFSGIIEALIPAVVTIRTNYGQGTGFIVDSEGDIVTNAHVLADSNGFLADEVRAITSSQEVKTAEFVGFNSELDIALLKISGNFQAVEFGDSNDVQA